MTRAYDAWLTVAQEAIQPRALDLGLPRETPSDTVAGLEGIATAPVTPQVITATAATTMGPARGADLQPQTNALNRDGKYHLWLSTITAHDGFLNTAMPDNPGKLAIWLDAMTEDDVIYVYPGSEYASEEGGGYGVPTIDGYITILNALYMTKARTIFVMDRMVSGMMAYIALACREVRATDFSCYAVYPPTTLRDGGNWAVCLGYFTNKLYERGVETKLLKANEFGTLKTMAAVYLGNDELKNRLPMHELG